MLIWIAVVGTVIAVSGLAVLWLLVTVASRLTELSAAMTLTVNRLTEASSHLVQKCTDALQGSADNRRRELDREIDSWKSVGGQIETAMRDVRDGVRALSTAYADNSAVLLKHSTALLALVKYHEASLKIGGIQTTVIERLNACVSAMASAIGLSRSGPPGRENLAPTDADAAAVEQNLAGLRANFNIGTDDDDLGI